MVRGMRLGYGAVCAYVYGLHDNYEKMCNILPYAINILTLAPHTPLEELSGHGVYVEEADVKGVVEESHRRIVVEVLVCLLKVVCIVYGVWRMMHGAVSVIGGLRL